jgi:Sulfotransferase domain
MTLRLIGAGLGRTGTASLKIALERIGFGPCYHMSELMMDPSRAPLWVRAAEGHPDWSAVFDGYASSVDYPGCTFWRELLEVYPDAKVLLSVRDPDKWFESTQATIFSAGMMGMLAASPLRTFIEQTVLKDFGERIHDRAFMVEYFRRHSAEVQAAVPRDRLLVYDVVQGWEPLCQFLQLPVPHAPFPRVNTREEHQRLQEMLRSGPPDLENIRAALKDRVRRSTDEPPVA